MRSEPVLAVIPKFGIYELKKEEKQVSQTVDFYVRETEEQLQMASTASLIQPFQDEPIINPDPEQDENKTPRKKRKHRDHQKNSTDVNVEVQTKEVFF
jgi:hypothetical protein